MSHYKLFRNILVVLLITISTLGYSQTVGPWDLGTLYEVPEWEVTNLAPQNGMTSMLITSVDYQGNPVQFFAYYSAPSGTMPSGGWPAMVHTHGGGGTAYPQWVEYFNDQGHAAISLDLEGHIPTKNASGSYLSSPNPGPSRSGVFNDYTLDIEDQWYYHAISQVILAHTLIASFPEVNADKIGVSGASWGGTITSTVMGVDNRWAWAAPVYGAGYLSETDGNQGDKISGDKADFVNEHFDGSAYFDRVDFPVLFINGTNDFNFAMPCNLWSAQHVNGQLLYSLRFGHSNLAPLRLNELYSFANQVSYGDDALPTFGTPGFNSSNVASVSFTAEAGISSAELLYTTDDGYWYEREWIATTASISGSNLSANLPSGTTTFYFTATDSRGLMLTSEFVEILGDPVAVTGVSVNPTSRSLSVGQAATLAATVLPTNATNKSVTWTSSNNSVATVNANGVVSAVATGTATITVITADGNETASCEVTVTSSGGSSNTFEAEDATITGGLIKTDTDASGGEYVDGNGGFNLSFGTTGSGEATLSFNIKSPTGSRSMGVFVDETKVGTVSASSNIWGVQTVSTTLSGGIIELRDSEGTSELDVDYLEVIVDGGGSSISVTGVSVTPENATLAVGGTRQLSETVSPSNATDPSVSWSSSNTQVAMVNSSGLITAVGVGYAIITATSTDGGYTGDCEVFVEETDVPVTGISISPSSASLTLGNNQQLSISVTPSNATNQNASWSSNNTSVATVNSSGLVTAVGIGSATITAISDDGGFSAQTSISVTTPSTGRNLALNGSASQSTTAYTGDASRAIDGNTNGAWSGGSVTHTSPEANPWWEVDLGGEYSIGNINIFGRTDACCAARLSDYSLTVFDADGETTFTEEFTDYPEVSTNAGDVMGQVIRIQLNTTNTALSLAEVQVFEGEESSNPTVNTITIQENETGFCSVDGNVNNNNASYTGDGFANTSNALGNGVNWEIDGSAGSYTFTWRYASANSRAGDLMVDGATVASNLVSTSSGSWSTWITESTTVSLGAGVKTVRLEATTASGLGNIDYMEVTGPDAAASGCISGARVGGQGSANQEVASQVAVTLYPNPVKDILTIQANKAEYGNYALYNMNGRVVLTDVIEINTTEIKLDFRDFDKGVYILMLNGNQMIQTLKVIKK